MASIYNIAHYKTGVDYGKNNIVSHNGVFYYSKIDVNNSVPSVDSPSWGGTINIQDGLTTSEKPYFFWPSSYGDQVTHQPKVQTIEFGDGYKQRIANGTNNNLLSFNLSFKERGEEEAAAILQFLASKEGYKPFYFKCPAPYSVIKKFICDNWSNSFVYQDHYNIQATFTETA